MSNSSVVRLPLWVVLNVPFAVILLISAGLVGYLGFQNGTNTASDLTRQLVSESSSRVEENLTSFFEIASKLNTKIVTDIRLKQLDLSDLSSMKLRFLAQLQTYRPIEGVLFASELREGASAFRAEPTAEYSVGELSAKSNYSYESFVVDDLGNEIKSIGKFPDFDPRPKPWYRAAVSAGKLTWTPVYPWSTQAAMSVDAVSPVYNESGTLLGVVDVSLNLASISEFLQKLYKEHNISIFIADDRGLLVAASTMPQPYTHDAQGLLQRYDTSTVADPFIQSATKQLNDQFGSWSAISTSKDFEFNLTGERQLAQVTPYEGLGSPWRIVVAIPESTYMSSINRHINETFLLIATSLLASVTVLTLVSLRITHPILRLSQAAKALATGRWSERVILKRRDEIGDLSTSFNYMADQLQQFTTSLQTSEARLRAVFENSIDAIVVTHQLLYVNYNPAFQKMFALKTPDELVGKPVVSIIAPHEGERIADYLRRRSQGEPAPNMYETIGHRLDGTEFDLEVRAAVYVQDGKRYTVALLRDITETKKAAQALQDSETRFRTIIETAPLGIVFSRNGQMLYANRQYITMFGYERLEELDDRPIIERVAPQYRDEITDRIRRRAAGEAVPNEYESVGLRKDGSQFPLAIWVVPINFSDEPAIVTFHIDLTERKQAEAILRDQDRLQLELQQQKELNNLKSRFVAMASHEFRTPLASILMRSSMLSHYRAKLTEEQITNGLDNISEQVNHLSAIIEDVLDLNRIQAGRIAFNPIMLNLDALCRSVLDDFQSNPSLLCDIQYTCNDPSRETLLDQHQMRQIVTNLVSNAIKYSPDNAPIIVTLDYTETTLEFRVKDSGIGIPESDLKHLFQPFHRADNVGSISGTGLGLVVTKELVELHSGTISVESQVDVGTTFIVNIPLTVIEV